jgi:chromosome segregation protein
LVHINRVELSHFKSFGGTVDIPLLEGFTVVTGPNGSGKSNILDGLLFALGLSTSKGMRADRLPDLVNQTHVTRSRSTVEASVSATFDLQGWQPDGQEAPLDSQNQIAVHSQLQEWTVTRKLRVTSKGTYTSSYYINGESCTLTQLHEQLHRLRIYPEGYNIVLQGDVTGIISMPGRERREIIDELAGVAQFDRKINQAKDKLDAVKEREDRCHIIERELQEQLERLAKDRLKAEKYQKLRQELHTKEQWGLVLAWQAQQKQLVQLGQQMEADDRRRLDLQQSQHSLEQTLTETATQLDHLNQVVKALGEEELLSLQSQVATGEAELRQVQRQQQELEAKGHQTQLQIQTAQADLQNHQTNMGQLQQQREALEVRELVVLKESRSQARQALEQSREAANAIANHSQVWVQQQTALRQQIDSLVQHLEPQRSHQAQLQERCQQLSQQIEAYTTDLEQLQQERNQIQLHQDLTQVETLAQQMATTAQQLAAAEQELQVQQQTQARLWKEQREKQRQLDKLESLNQALQETQGTHATQLILQRDIPGVHGLVAQLGQVEPRYQRALETAAGGRLGHLVVEDDRVAEIGIQLLKQQNAGRATFLPLNKIRGGSLANLPKWQSPEGLIDHAVNLITCDDRYRDIFSYIFGNTVVFATLAQARQYLKKYRIVTLDGELLEMSGAMTGGSVKRRTGSLSFGRVEATESAEMQSLRQRLQEIDQILARCEHHMVQLTDRVRQKTEELAQARHHHREVELETQQQWNTVERLNQQLHQLGQNRDQNRHILTESQARLQRLNQELPLQEVQLQQLRQQMAELEKSPIHNQWQQRQAVVQQQEALLQERELALRSAEQQLQDLSLRQQQLIQQNRQTQLRLQDLRQQQAEQINQHSSLHHQNNMLQGQIAQFKNQLTTLEQKLGTEKQMRDRVERQLRDHQAQKQQLSWQLQKLEETQQERQGQCVSLKAELAEKQSELPEPLPEIPEEVQTQGLEALQHQLRSLAKRIQAMEPVNMLALEEYDRTQERLNELTEKLATLESERTELLLRVENFTTLRQQAFMQSFDAINQNFKEIFAQLSEGDGYLQLDNPEDPLNSGLNLVAHPKGKPVRRLASMSGGEKSLTALSFIFALQRYRPSPFYAFDEVDSFLDGANVERLARIIRQQSGQAQFIVVSHRRPMIESAQRTIGVTQARGSYTQVLGITLEPQSASG